MRRTDSSIRQPLSTSQRCEALIRLLQSPESLRVVMAEKRVTKSKARTRVATVTLAQLVERPYLAFRLDVGEAPQVLAQVNTLLTRVTELQSNLQRMMPSTTRILGRPLAEVRRVLRSMLVKGSISRPLASESSVMTTLFVAFSRIWSQMNG
jgi:hypothetical protein